MTPLEALQILDNLASGVQLNRADHIKVNEAVQTLLKVITPVTPVQEVEKQPDNVAEQ